MRLNAVSAVKCQRTGKLTNTHECKWCSDVIELYHDWDEHGNIISAVYCSYGDENNKVT